MCSEGNSTRKTELLLVGLMHLREGSATWSEVGRLFPLSYTMPKTCCNFVTKCKILNNLKAFMVNHIYTEVESKTIFDNTPVLMEANMDEEVHVEEHTTTEFVDDGSITQNLLDISPEFMYAKERSDICDFLGKDYLANTLSWTTSTTPLTNAVGTWDPFTFLITDPKYQRKLYGFNLIRCNVEVTIKLNANPMQAGLLRLAFIPCAQQRSAAAVGTRFANLATFTQLPGVDISCRETSVTLKIPYVTPFSYKDLTNNPYQGGLLYLRCISRLATGVSGQTSVDVSCFFRYTDVVLAAPLVANSISDMESEKAAKGSISQGLRTTARIVRSLSAIPSLTQYAAPTAWALDRAAGVASHFGYSKPDNDVTAQPIIQNPQFEAATSDGVDNSSRLGVLRSNAVKVLTDVTITPEDEMSMAFLLARKALLATISWTSSTTGNLLSRAIGPNNLYTVGSYSSAAKTATYRTGPPVYYFSNYFKQWRGSIELEIHIIKTMFHSGRLAVVWSPAYTGVTAPADSTFCLREIIDIRTTDKIKLNLPYLIPMNFVDKGTTFGWLSIQIINELRAPETVSSSVDVLTYYSAGPDFEFANPSAGVPMPVPLCIGNSGFDEPEPRTIISTGIGGERILPLSLIPSQMSVGECVTSVKQLINRNSQFYFDLSFDNIQDPSIMPWIFGTATTTAGAIVASTTGGDTLSIIAPLYGFFRGSMRIGYNLIGGGTPVNMYLRTHLTNVIEDVTTTVDSCTTAWGDPAAFVKGLAAIAPCNEEQGMYFAKVPYYNDTRVSLCDLQTSVHLSAYDSSIPTIGVVFENANIVNGNRFYRSACDDFQFSYFLGCPPVLVTFA